MQYSLRPAWEKEWVDTINFYIRKKKYDFACEICGCNLALSIAKLNEIFDDLLANYTGWGTKNIQVGYKEILDNMDNFITFVSKNNIRCTNCEYLFSRFLTNASTDKQAVYWIMEDIASDISTFANKNISIELRLSNGRRIDVAVDNPPMWIEYKWYGGDDKIKQSLFIDEFVNRDLAGITDLKQLQWRIKGQKLTKEEVVEFLSSQEGREALKNNKIINLIDDYAEMAGYSNSITNVDDAITFLNKNNTWFNLIFK